MTCFGGHRMNRRGARLSECGAELQKPIITAFVRFVVFLDTVSACTL
jgi:hypothetical protein